MKKLIGTIILLLGVVINNSSDDRYSLLNKKENKREVKSQKIKPVGIVVLELFTSQGCSSCPPADVVLSNYSIVNDSTIIPLAFHVDYWNYIGWKDPFSKAQYSNRQREYGRFFNLNGVYTPQLVINGKYELVGSKKNEIETLVKKELLLKNSSSIEIQSIRLLDNQLKLKISTINNTSNFKINIALVKKKEFTKIERGENKGLALTSYNIVYDFKTATNSKDNEIFFNFQKEWNTSDFIIVAYIQNTETGVISAATKSEINL